MFKSAPFIEGDDGHKLFELAVNGTKSANEALDIAHSVVVVEEVDLLDGIEMEKGGLKMEIVNTVEVSREVLQNVNPNFLWHDGLVSGHCS